jgi:REP element-mobilizing transposase RayT
MENNKTTLSSQRHSLRLKDYDYSQAGAYFVTLVTQGRNNLWGQVIDEAVNLNPSGEMVSRWWQELEVKFSSVKIDEFVVMPNHLHGIIWLYCQAQPEIYLSDIIRWFKTMTTNEYIRGVKNLSWPPFNKRVWQRNYFDHIIRDEVDWNNHRLYILDNPRQWSQDVEYQ